MENTVSILLMITGFGMVGFWVMHILKGGLPQGIRTLENGGYIGFHIFIELLTGLLCLICGISIILSRDWSSPLALVAGGMLLYTSINSLAWSEVKNKPVLALMFIVPGIIAILTVSYFFTVV